MSRAHSCLFAAVLASAAIPALGAAAAGSAGRTGSADGATAGLARTTGVDVGTAHHVSFAWPGGAKAAVSLAYDDALDSQLDHAIPALDRHGLKASFYLTLASPVVTRRLPEWRAAAANGHELGNHSLFHQCSRGAPGREWVSLDNDLDRISVAQLVAQIRVGNGMLQAIDGKTLRTYTVPCGDALAGGENYLPALHADFVAIKSAAGPAISDMQTLDPHAVPVIAPSDVTGRQLIAMVEQAAAAGTMVNFTFHGVGGDHLAISSAAHEELLQFLARNRQTYWTATFLDIMGHVLQDRRAAGAR